MHSDLFEKIIFIVNRFVWIFRERKILLCRNIVVKKFCRFILRTTVYIYIYRSDKQKLLPYFKKLLTARKKERKKERKRNEEKKMNFHRDYVHWTRLFTPHVLLISKIFKELKSQPFSSSTKVFSPSYSLTTIFLPVARKRPWIYTARRHFLVCVPR